jgi:hypothetical protein
MLPYLCVITTTNQTFDQWTSGILISSPRSHIAEYDLIPDLLGVNHLVRDPQ